MEKHSGLSSTAPHPDHGEVPTSDPQTPLETESTAPAVPEQSAEEKLREIAEKHRKEIYALWKQYRGDFGQAHMQGFVASYLIEAAKDGMALGLRHMREQAIGRLAEHANQCRKYGYFTDEQAYAENALLAAIAAIRNLPVGGSK